MQEAVPVGGAMSAVLGLDIETIQEICAETPGIVEVANDNCPGQTVISGEARAVASAGEAMKAAGAKVKEIRGSEVYEKNAVDYYFRGVRGGGIDGTHPNDAGADNGAYYLCKRH